MKKFISLLLIFSLLFCSCSSTLYPLTDQGCAEVNDQAEGKGGTIVLRITEEEIEAESIRLQQDSLYWTVEADEMPGYFRQQIPIPVDMISEINITSHLNGLLVWGGVGMIPYFIVATTKPGDQEKGYAFAVLTALVFTTLGIIGYVNGIDHHYLVTDPKQWSELNLAALLIGEGQKDRALEILDRTINESGDATMITTALFIKMQNELADPVTVYEALKAGYPDHIYTLLAERVLYEKYGIRPVKS